MKMLSTSCGIGHWRPKWLQRFATRRVYISVYCIIGVIHGMLFSYFSTILSTIEKKFGLKSQEIAWVYSGNEISQVFFLVALPFMGLVRKRTLFMGISIMLSGVGILLCGIPHFFQLQSSTEASAPKNYLCLEKSSVSSCPSVPEDEETSQETKWMGISLIFFGIFLHGIGSSFYNSFGIPYIDDNSQKRNSPLALSFVFAAKMGGPLFGAIFGSIFLKMNEYPERNPEMLGFDEKDDRWIGAWWLGFFIFGPVLIILAPLIMLFPEQLPKREGKINKESEFASETPGSASEWVEMTKSLLSRLLNNKIYIFNLCSNIAFLFGFMGFITFLPKFIKFNFRKSSSSSGLAGGMSNFVSSGIGIITSGWIISRYKLKARSLALWCVFADFIGIFFFIGAIFIGCNSVNFLESCESSCHCTDSDYLPVCSFDETQQFMSPCFAGCTSSFEDPGGNTVYQNCSCIAGGNITMGNAANTKYCDDPSCASHFLIFIAFLGVFGIIGTSTRIPNLIISLRAIDPKDKASALTLSVSLLSLFAFLPATVVFGAIIDRTCKVWGTNECSNEESNCLVYDNASMRLYSGVFMSFFIAVEAVFDLLVWYYSKDLVLYEEQDNDEEGESSPTLLKMT